MSDTPTSSSATGANGIPAFVAPLIGAYAESMRPIIVLLVIHSILGAICVPLLLALLHFSTARIRRTPLFLFVVFDILLGIAISIWVHTVTLGVLLDPLKQVPVSTFIAFPVLLTVSTWIVDLVLLLRLYAVFPYRSTSTPKFIAIFAFPLLIKISRIVVIATSVSIWARSILSVANPEALATTNLGLTRSPLLKAEYLCEIGDHLYVASLFLWKLRAGFARSADSGRVTNGSNNSIAGRIRTLFYIALGNFVFPVIFNIVLLVIVWDDRAPKIDIIYVTPVNFFVTIFGVVFATVWNSSYEHAQMHAPSTVARTSPPLPPLAFRRTNGGSGGSATFTTGPPDLESSATTSIYDISVEKKVIYETSTGEHQPESFMEVH